MEAEKQTVQMLLEKGVKVQFPAPFFLRILGRKKLTLTLTYPTLNTLLKIAHHYLKIGQDVTVKLHTQKAMQLLANDGKKVRKIVAMALLNNSSLFWLSSWLGKQLGKSLKPADILYLYQLIVLHGGLEDFLNTIRLIHQTRITKPMNLSPNERES